MSDSTSSKRPKSAMTKRVALLDVDGTLVDSNDAHAWSWVQAIEESGRHVAYERIRERIGEGGDKLLPETIGVDSDSREGKRIASRRGEIFRRDYLPTLRAFDGARDLLMALRARDFLLVVATSAQKDEVSRLLKQVNLFEFIHDAATSSDADDSKPDPDIVLAALRTVDCPPKNAVMIGDTPYDVEAALQAGVEIVGLRCGGWSDDDLRGAAAVYDDAHDLLIKLESSPFAR